MKQEDYNAVRNHFGRQMYKQHVENIQNTASHQKDILIEALIGSTKWWIRDPDQGTYGEIKRREREDEVISKIFLQMSKTVASPTSAETHILAAKESARGLVPHHPARLGVAVALSTHYGVSRDFVRAISTAREALNSVIADDLTADCHALLGLLQAKTNSFEKLWVVSSLKLLRSHQSQLEFPKSLMPFKEASLQIFVRSSPL